MKRWQPWLKVYLQELICEESVFESYSKLAQLQSFLGRRQGHKAVSTVIFSTAYSSHK